MNPVLWLGKNRAAAITGIIRSTHTLIRAARGRSLHAELVLNSCATTGNVVQQISEMEYGATGLGLLRLVLELTAGTLHLAKNPDDVDDFQNFGKWLQCEIEQILDPTFPPLPNQQELRKHFEQKREKGGGRTFVTWHGMTQEKLIQSTIPGSRDLKNQSSAFLHGDSLIAMAAMRYSPENGWHAKPFYPMVIDPRIPIYWSINLYASLLISVNEILQLGCDEAAATITELSKVTQLPVDLHG